MKLALPAVLIAALVLPVTPASASILAGDVTGDGRAEIVLAPAAGIGSVRVYDGATGGLVKAFFPYAEGYAGGVSVAVADLEGDGRAEIATAAGSHVRVFDGSGTVLRAFFAYDPAAAFAVNVAAGDLDGDGRAELVTVPASGAPAHVRVFAGGVLTRAFIAGEPASKAGATVAAGPGGIIVGSGSTIRVIDPATLATTAFFLPFGLSAAQISVAV